jgi:hypothetical protein
MEDESLGLATETKVEWLVNTYFEITREKIAEFPVSFFYLVVLLRFGWCMVAPVTQFVAVCSIIIKANQVTDSANCNLFGQSSDPDLYCDAPYGMVFNIINLCMVVATYAVILWRSQLRFQQLCDAGEVDVFDVALCFHINRALCHLGARIMHYVVISAVLIGMIVSLANAENNGVSVAGEVISATYIELILLVFSAFKMLSPVGTHMDRVSYKYWDEARKNKCATLVLPLHPVASIWTRSISSTLTEEVASVFRNLATVTANPTITILDSAAGHHPSSS